MKKIQSVEEVTQLIKEGKVLSLAGDERALSQLPAGQWIAGTTPYFMGDAKGLVDQDVIYVDVLSEHITQHKIVSYDLNSIASISSGQYDNGFTLLVIPAFSELHSSYALNAPDYEGIYNQPVLGWVSGIDLDSDDTPKIYNGLTGEVSSDKAVAIFVELPANQLAELGILNIHKADPGSPDIQFDVNSFEVSDCWINGEKQNFAEYITKNKIDTKPPLICSYAGADINVCIKEVDEDQGKVHFYAPVFKGRKYKIAVSLEDYAQEFSEQLPVHKGTTAFSCNCILNFLYGELEGKKAGKPGPITFGEIGYHLLNQTMTYLDIIELDDE